MFTTNPNGVIYAHTAATAAAARPAAAQLAVAATIRPNLKWSAVDGIAPTRAPNQLERENAGALQDCAY